MPEQEFDQIIIGAGMAGLCSRANSCCRGSARF